MNTPHLIIEKRDDGTITCHKEGDVGMYIEGKGMSVLEAIGDWCVYSGIITAQCIPPEILANRFALGFKPPSSR